MLVKHEGKIGDIGQFSAGITKKGELEAMVGVKISLVAELKKLAAKTNTPLDDKALEWVEGMLEKLDEQA